MRGQILLRIIPAAALTITLCLASFAVHAAETVVLTETPSDINISASYRGTTLHVEGWPHRAAPLPSVLRAKKQILP